MIFLWSWIYDFQILWIHNLCIVLPFYYWLSLKTPNGFFGAMSTTCLRQVWLKVLSEGSLALTGHWRRSVGRPQLCQRYCFWHDEEPSHDISLIIPPTVHAPDQPQTGVQVAARKDRHKKFKRAVARDGRYKTDYGKNRLFETINRLFIIDTLATR